MSVRVGSPSAERGTLNSKQTESVAKGTETRAVRELVDTNSLSTYFREMSRTPLLTPERESELAVEIATRDEHVWAEILSYPGSVEHVLRVTEQLMLAERIDVQASEFRRLRGAATRAKKLRRKATQASLERAACKAAAALRRLDLQHKVLDEVLAELAHIRVTRSPRAGKTALGFSAASQGFREHLDRVRTRRDAALASRNRANDAIAVM